MLVVKITPLRADLSRMLLSIPGCLWVSLSLCMSSSPCLYITINYKVWGFFQLTQKHQCQHSQDWYPFMPPLIFTIAVNCHQTTQLFVGGPFTMMYTLLSPAMVLSSAFVFSRLDKGSGFLKVLVIRFSTWACWCQFNETPSAHSHSEHEKLAQFLSGC